jgi:hypothetical protein
MNEGDPPKPRWKWVQVESFQPLAHPEWDLIQWNLEDELVKGPREISHQVHEEDLAWWYLKSKDAPGLAGLPPVVVLFRIATEPSGDQPGVIEGWEAWWDDDLETALLRMLKGRPVL